MASDKGEIDVDSTEISGSCVSLSNLELPSQMAETSQLEPPLTKKSLSFILAFASLMTTNFISIMDTVIVAAALPEIAHSLNARSNEAYWAGSAFLFAQAVSQPLYGTLSTVFGRKACLLFAMGIFTAASLFCATAKNMTWLVAARVFQGLGAGGINAVGSIIVTDMVSLRERGKYIGILSISTALGLVCGILLGAAIADLSSWRIIFWINLPLGIPSLAGVYFFINLESELRTTKERLKRVDWIGSILLTTSLISFLFGVTSGGVLHSWDSASVISPIIVGVFGTVGFLFYEGKYAVEPMIPLRIFASRTAGAGFLSSFMLGFVLWAMQYYLILYFLVTQKHSLFTSGVSILPGSIFVPVTAFAGGLVISKLQRFRTINSIAWLTVTIGFSLMTQLRIDSHKAMQFGFQVIYGAGGGVLFPGRLCAVQAAQEDSDVPMATALVSFLISLGEAFGVGIGGVIFQNQWSKQIRAATMSKMLAPEYVLSYREAEQTSELIKPFPETIQVFYRVVMSNVINTLFLVLAVLSAMAFVTSLISKNLSLDRDTRSTQQFKEKPKVKDRSV